METVRVFELGCSLIAAKLVYFIRSYSAVIPLTLEFHFFLFCIEEN
jgi:hypothetical protein